MRPNNTDAVFSNSGTATRTYGLQLDLEASPHLIGILTQIASEPIGYLVREVTTNAIDSHIEAGVSAPVKLTAPTPSHLFFEVDDQGVGLSPDDLENVYSFYGRSTKRDSDTTAGTLGLGSKSPLAYADSFDVTLSKGGVTTLAVIAKDENGVGQVNVIDTSFTGAPNGVKVTVPVKERDIWRFTNAIDDIVPYLRPGTVTVNGEQPETVWDDPDLIWVDEDIAVGNNSKYSDRIVQHNVAYPFNSGSSLDVIAFVPTGTVNFTPSREALEYTDRTNDTIEVIREFAKERFAAHLVSQFESLTTDVDRIRFLATWSRHFPQALREDYWRSVGGHYVRIGGSSSRDAWSWNASSGSKASRVSNITWPELVIGNRSQHRLITGYPHRSVTPLARARLIDQYYGANVLLFPSGTDLSLVEGFATITAWDDVLAATPDVKAPRGKGGKGETVYEVRKGTSHLNLTLPELVERADGAPVVFSNNLYSAEKTPEAYLVVAEDRSHDRIRRFFPGAVRAHEYIAQQLAVATAALTEQDEAVLAARGLDSTYTAFSEEGRLDEVADPELRQAIEAKVGAKDSLAIKRFRSLGGVYAVESPHIDDLNQRYPLVVDHSRYGLKRILDDALIYINAKYNSQSDTGSAAAPNPAKEQTT